MRPCACTVETDLRIAVRDGRRGPESPSDLPVRPGPAPATCRRNGSARARGRAQLSQNADPELQLVLLARTALLDDASVDMAADPQGYRRFRVSPRGARKPGEVAEFARLHPPEDGSFDVALPGDWLRVVVERGWGEPLERSGLALIFGPRDDAELEVVGRVLRVAHAYARRGLVAVERGSGHRAVCGVGAGV